MHCIFLKTYAEKKTLTIGKAKIRLRDGLYKKKLNYQSEEIKLEKKPSFLYYAFSSRFLKFYSFQKIGHRDRGADINFNVYIYIR